MPSHTLDQWRHTHDFHIDSSHGEKRTLYVVLLTAFMMVVEIAAGYALGQWRSWLTVGTWEPMSLLLASPCSPTGTQDGMPTILTSVSAPGRFNEAIAVAVTGLIVNLVSAWLLQDIPGLVHTTVEVNRRAIPDDIA